MRCNILWLILCAYAFPALFCISFFDAAFPDEAVTTRATKESHEAGGQKSVRMNDNQCNGGCFVLITCRSCLVNRTSTM